MLKGALANHAGGPILKSFYISLLSIIIISCVGIIVYSNSYYCSFHFDDAASVVDNIYIRNIHHLQDIWNCLPRRFILYLSIALNYHFNGLHVFGYHLFNLAVHIGAAILVWWLTLLTFSTPVMKEEKIAQHAKVISLFAALVFVVHPIQTEAVTYIVQRAASMATLFYLASLCFYIKARLHIMDSRHRLWRGSALGGGFRGNDKNNGVYYICSLITAILAMFTKEIAITLPLMILLYEFCFFPPKAGQFQAEKTKENYNWRYLAPFLLTVFIIPVTMLFTETDAARMRQLYNEPGISSFHYLLTQFRVIVTYIRLVFLPLNQNLDYSYPVSKTIFELHTLTSFLFLTAILFLAKSLFLKYRLVSFSIFWFFLTLLPESSFLPIKDVIFEHRLYLPLVGYSLFLVSGVYYWTGLLYRHSEQSEESKGILRSFASLKMTTVVLTMITVCYGALTYQRNIVWKDDLTLWNDVVHKSPYKVRAYTNRGFAYYQLGGFTKALSDYNEAINLYPKFPDVYYNRGNVYFKQGNFDLAIADYNKAIVFNPHNEDAYNNRGLAYYKKGNFIQAVFNYNKAIKLNPKNVDAYQNRALLYSHLKKNDKSLGDVLK